MSHDLHSAIEDAIRDAPAYHERGILVTRILEATRPLHADGSLLYQATYTIFRAMPSRLVPGTVLGISTRDVADGIELAWTARERLDLAPQDADLRATLATGPHGDLLDIALFALENFCHMRAGTVDSKSEEMRAYSAFDRPPHVVRRVTARIPALPPPEGVSVRLRAPPQTHEALPLQQKDQGRGLRGSSSDNDNLGPGRSPRSALRAGLGVPRPFFLTRGIPFSGSLR